MLKSKRIRKRGLAALLVMICLISMTNLCSYAAGSHSSLNPSPNQTETDWTYVISGNNATILAYTGNDATVTTPTILGGYVVNAIGTGAFVRNNTIETLIISEGVVTIADESILGCQELKEIRYPATFRPPISGGDGTRTGLTFIPEYCPKLETITVAAENPYLTTYQGDLYNKAMTSLLFHPPASTITTLTVPDGVKNIGSTACKDSLTLEKVVLPDSVTYIGYWAFTDCSNLTEIKMSANCQIIDQYAFHLTGLTELKLPATLTEFNLNDLSMPSLTSFVVAENNPTFSSENGVLYNGDKTKLLLCPIKKEGELALPESVLTIEVGAFHPEGILTSVTIPYQVLGIGKGNFNSDCEIKGYTGSAAEAYATEQGMPFVSLGETPISTIASGNAGANITWTLSSESVLTISGTGNMEFALNSSQYYEAPWLAYQDAIRNVVIENGVTDIGENAFMGCDNLENVMIPETVVSIHSSAFYACVKMKTITLPDSLTTIGEHVFGDCFSLETIHIPAKLVNGLDGSDFRTCKALTKYTVSEENTAYKAIDGILYSKNGETLVAYPANRGVEKYIVEDFVKTIGQFAFAHADIWTIILPDSVTTLEKGAFANSSVYHMEFGNGITNVPQEAFYSCQSLLYLFVKSSLQTVSYRGFVGCYSLTYVYYDSDADAWSQITFENSNTPILSAQKYYNTTEEYFHTITGHFCQEPTWTWASDYSSATATFTCDVCNYNWDESASSTMEYVPATDDEDVKAIYSVSIMVDVVEYVDVKVIPVELGDVNTDGEIDALDALLVLKSVARMLELTSEQIALADVNGDTDVDANDALMILKYTANIISSFQ